MKWRDEATVGDALQTLGDELRIGVVVEPAVLATRDNDWQAFLREPLKVGEVKTTDGLTLKGLIDLLGKQLNATTELNDFLTFDLSDDTVGPAPDETDAANRDVEEE